VKNAANAVMALAAAKAPNKKLNERISMIKQIKQSENQKYTECKNMEAFLF